MDGNLLRSWLGLPPGPWPPDDRTLLGLPEQADPAEVERRALMLMGRLRPHQLLHPELVTEGMNRLAQAMLAVTTFGQSKPTAAPPQAPSPPPAQPVQRIPSPSPTQTIPKPTQALKPAQPVKPPEQFDFGPKSATPGQIPPPAPRVLDAEPVVLDAEAVPGEVAPPIEFQEKPLVRRRSHEPESSLASLLPTLPKLKAPFVGPTAADRRQAYFELAGWRGLLQAWEKLKPWLGDPAEELLSPAAVFDFLEAIEAVRQAQTHKVFRKRDWYDEAPFVQSLLDQPQVLPVFRTLVYGQRQGLATDWARAKARWEDHLLDLRLEVRRAARAVPRPFIKGLCRWLANNPEWLLGVCSILVILIALTRVILSIVLKPSGG